MSLLSPGMITNSLQEVCGLQSQPRDAKMMCDASSRCKCLKARLPQTLWICFIVIA